MRQTGAGSFDNENEVEDNERSKLYNIEALCYQRRVESRLSRLGNKICVSEDYFKVGNKSSAHVGATSSGQTSNRMLTNVSSL